MIEPWVTSLSRLAWHLHHEPFFPDARDWEVHGGALTGANIALPWIIFQRDRAQFKIEFPQWKIKAIQPFMPLCYTLSGGVSLESLMPGDSFNPWRRVEEALAPWMGRLAMFAQIELSRRRT